MAEEFRGMSLTSPLGPLWVAASEGGICRVAFEREWAAFLTRLAVRGGPAVAELAEPSPEVVRQFGEYFSGQRQAFTLPLDYRFATPFQRLAYEALLRVPLGKVVSYRDLAQAIGRPRASRAVGQAMARNPLPILVPCHRVLRRDGMLGGYTGGLHIKEYLLALEGVLLPVDWGDQGFTIEMGRTR